MFNRVICGTLLGLTIVVTPALLTAQDNDPVGTNTADRPVTRRDADDDRGFDPGWLGLIGLAGLAGLKRRDRQDNHRTGTSTTNR
jgi:MYXO-CTERM domain-containing protein